MCVSDEANPIPFLILSFLVFVANGLNTLLIEWRLDHNYHRFFLFVCAPFLACVSLVSLDVSATQAFDG